MNFIWRPDTFIPNAKLAMFHAVTRHNAFIRIMPHGHVKQSMRITVTAACPMDFRLFPMDSQLCTIQLESFSLAAQEMRYHWEEIKETSRSPPISIGADAGSLPQLVIRGFRAVESIHERLEGRNHSRLTVEIFFSRSLGYYVIQIYLPASLVVVISWISFWISRHSQPARVLLGVTTVLTLTMMTGQGISSLPKISYLKAIDLFMIFCFTMVFLALIEYAVVSYAVKRSRKKGDKEITTNSEGELVRSFVAENLISSIPILAAHSPILRKKSQMSNATTPLSPFLPMPQDWQQFGPRPSVRFENTTKYNEDDDEDLGWTLRFPASLPSRIEWVSRFAFPAVFLTFNVFYWNYFLDRHTLINWTNLPGFIEYET